MSSRKIIIVSLFFLAGFHGHAQESFRAEMLKEVNRARQEGCLCGEKYMPPAKALRWNEKLEKAARSHAVDMYANNFFSHTGSKGRTLKDRVNAAGYKWSFIGENISWGYHSAQEVVRGWIDSPEHCHNLMEPEFKEMGAAREGTYWVLDLGL